MQKAAEDLRNEALAKAQEKEQYINERVTPLQADGLGQGKQIYLDYNCQAWSNRYFLKIKTTKIGLCGQMVKDASLFLL